MLPERILVIRFSAMGDVMLVVPALCALTSAYPNIEVTLVTRPRFAAFFKNIRGVKVFEADVDYQYSGFLGMRSLFKALMRKGDYDLVIDLHDHLRTMILRSFFVVFGKKVIVFKKGRKEKKAFSRKHEKITQPLIHTVERYCRAFEKAGFMLQVPEKPFLLPDAESVRSVQLWLDRLPSKQERWIGIAPFAMHNSKIWPVQNYTPLIETILRKTPAHFFFFGGGDKEVDFFNQLKTDFPGRVTVVAGALTMRQEIALLRHIDLMLCVDSSNMHLAALTNTPLVSIWGGTHPDVGFGPFQYDEKSILQIDRETLPCRPCSVYGRSTCLRGDFACLNWISVEKVAEAILIRLEA